MLWEAERKRAYIFNSLSKAGIKNPGPLILQLIIIILLENATELGERMEFYINNFTRCATSLSQLCLRVVHLYLHCGLSHRADM